MRLNDGYKMYNYKSIIPLGPGSSNCLAHRVVLAPCAAPLARFHTQESLAYRLAQAFSRIIIDSPFPLMIFSFH